MSKLLIESCLLSLLRAIAFTVGLVGCSAGLYGDSISDQGRVPMAPVPNIVDAYGNPAPELQSTPSPQTQTMPMLQDPDSQQDWTQEVSVKYNKDEKLMKAEAMRKCQEELKGDPLTQLVDTYQRTKTPNQGGNVKWICQFRGETEEAPIYADDTNQN